MSGFIKFKTKTEAQSFADKRNGYVMKHKSRWVALVNHGDGKTYALGEHLYHFFFSDTCVHCNVLPTAWNGTQWCSPDCERADKFSK